MPTEELPGYREMIRMNPGTAILTVVVFALAGLLAAMAGPGLVDALAMLAASGTLILVGLLSLDSLQCCVDETHTCLRCRRSEVPWEVPH